jgi:electron transfer flavoprotein beta subunit
MRILTYLRQVLDAEESVHVANGAVALENSKLVMDTMDEYGVEEALRLRESGIEAEIIAVAVGPARTQDALRTALAMGVDRAIHVETDTRLDAIALSKVLAQIAQQEDATLIFSGGQQADWDSNALGAPPQNASTGPRPPDPRPRTKGSTLTGSTTPTKAAEFSPSSSRPSSPPSRASTSPATPPPQHQAKKKNSAKNLDQFNVSPKLKFVSAESR